MSCVDYMLPALSTLPAALSFMLQRWIAQPDVLRRIQAEIDTVVGRGRLPELDDRARLPYTEAALRETLRLRTIIPSGFPHRALRDTRLGGFDVPRGAFVVTNLQAAHWDAAQYGDDALRFRPERFLDAHTGELRLGSDTTLPFGAGKRLCAGETFSRNMLFVLSAALAQNFDARVEEGWSPDVDELRTGIVSVPAEMWVRFEPR